MNKAGKPTTFSEGILCRETRRQFKRYLESVFSDEIMLFWLAIDKFNNKLGKHKSDYDKMYSLACEIYTKFLKPMTRRKSQPRKTKHNKRFANISESCIKNIGTRLNHPDGVVLPDLFTSAQSEVAEQLQSRWTIFIQSETK